MLRDFDFISCFPCYCKWLHITDKLIWLGKSSHFQTHRQKLWQPDMDMLIVNSSIRLQISYTYTYNKHYYTSLGDETNALMVLTWKCSQLPIKRTITNGEKFNGFFVNIWLWQVNIGSIQYYIFPAGPWTRENSEWQFAICQTTTRI